MKKRSASLPTHENLFVFFTSFYNLILWNNVIRVYSLSAVASCRHCGWPSSWNVLSQLKLWGHKLGSQSVVKATTAPEMPTCWCIKSRRSSSIQTPPGPLLTCHVSRAPLDSTSLQFSSGSERHPGFFEATQVAWKNPQFTPKWLRRRIQFYPRCFFYHFILCYDNVGSLVSRRQKKTPS